MQMALKRKHAESSSMVSSLRVSPPPQIGNHYTLSEGGMLANTTDTEVTKGTKFTIVSNN
jgi:hypothetical protein